MQADCQAQSGTPSSLQPPPCPPAALSLSLSLFPPLVLSRSMLPLLTAENRALLPAPSAAPPARLRPPRSSRRNREEFAAEALHPGAGPAEGAAGGAEALVWGRGRRMGKHKGPPRAGPRGANGNERASPEARESRSGTKNFLAGKSLAVLGWDSVNLCEGVGGRPSGLRGGSEPTS